MLLGMNTGGKAGKEDGRSGQSWEAGSTVKVLAAHVTKPPEILGDASGRGGPPLKAEPQIQITRASWQGKLAILMKL